MKKRFVVLAWLILFPVMLLSFGKANARIVNGCLLGPGLTDCSQFVNQIRTAGHNPDDPNTCFVIMNNDIEVRDCSTAPFNVQPGQTITESLEAEQRTVSSQSLQEALNDPKRVSCDGADQNCIRNIPLIQLINLGINILSGVVVAVVIAVIVVAGIQYSAAGGNPNGTAAAKGRIINAIIALVAYLLLFMLFTWLIPGGLL